MNNLGEYLKKEREKKGITLDEVSNFTRIRKTYLQEIEDGNIEMQPPVFIKGFLKSYAEFLGLDGQEILEKYNDIIKEKEGTAEAEKGFELEPVVDRRRYLIPALLALSLITAIYLLSTSNDSDTTPTKLQKVAKVETPQQKTVLANTTTYHTPLAIMTTSQTIIFKLITTSATPASPTTKPTVQTVQKTKQAEKQYTLSVKARELTWLMVTVDNNDPVEVLLKEGEGTSWSADSKITVVAGNAGGVDLTFNGKPVESLGPSGKVVTKIFPE